MLKHLLAAVLFYWLSFASFAQQVITSADDTVAVFAAGDSLEASRFAYRWVADQVDAGYIQARIDHYQKNDSAAVWKMQQGPFVKITEVSLIDQNIDTTVSLLRTSAVLEKLSNQGYPFARLELAGVKETGDAKLSVIYIIDYGPVIYFDSVLLINEIPVKSSVLYKLLDIYPGQLYSDNKFGTIPERVNEIEFLELNADPDIGFYADKALVYLNLQSVSKNSFDAMLGFLPATRREGNAFNGYVDLHLTNLFRSAVTFDAEWKAFGPLSQTAKLRTVIPAIGRTGIGMELHGEILRQDSSFVNSGGGARLSTRLFPRTRMSVGYDRATSTQLGREQAQIRSYTYDWYTLSFCKSCRLSADEARQKSRSIHASVSLGSRELQETDTLILSSLSWRLAGRYQQKMLLGQRALFQAQFDFGVLANESGTLLNERFRLGGLATLRGFFENQFFVDQFFTSRNEYRFYLEKKTYLMGFVDGGMIRTVDKNFYGSTGIGISISTNAGNLNLIFANGRIFDNISSSSNNLIHFGYSAVF